MGVTKKERELRKQEAEILEKAKASGVADSYLFTTTFERYQTQIRMCIELEKEYKGHDILVKKEYVKGRENLYTNPIIKEYNATAGAANKTAETLIKLIKAAGEKEEEKPKVDPLIEALKG